MTKKEKKIAMSLFAALGLSPGLSQAEPIIPPIDGQAAIVRAGDIELSYRHSEVYSALQIIRGNDGDLPEIQFHSGNRMLSEIEALRAGDVPVELGGTTDEAIGLLKSLIESNTGAFRVDASISAVIFFQKQ